MGYEKIPPNKKLTPYVICYYHWKQTLKEELKVQSPPSGFEALVFNYGDPYQIDTVAEKKIVSPISFYSGQNTSNYDMLMNGEVDIFGVVMKPCAFYSLFRVVVKGTVDKRIPLVKLLAEEGEKIEKEMLSINTIDQKVNYIDELLLQKSWIAELHDDPVEKAANLITKHKGKLSIKDLMEEMPYSRRTLERNFQEKIGVSPKMLARICRFANMSYLLMYRKANWQELVYEGGYTDQSHFIKDFQFFNRQSPNEYLRNHKELVKFLG